MIVNLTKGKSSRGGLGYDYGPGNKEEHENPRRVAGNVAGQSYQQRASRFERAQKSYTQQTGRTPKEPVVRMAVAANPEDAKMSDRQWGQIAHETVDEFTKGKADTYPWEAVRHDDGHIHITLSRCGSDGKLLPSSNDYKRAQKIGRNIEKKYDLVETKNRVFGKKSEREAESVRTGPGHSDEHSVSGRGDDMPTRETSRRQGADQSTQQEGKSMAEQRRQVLQSTEPHSEQRRQALAELRDQESQQRGTPDETTREPHGARSRSVEQDQGVRQPGHDDQQLNRRNEQPRRARDHDATDAPSSQSDTARRDRQRILETTKPGSPERQQALRDLRQSQEQQSDPGHKDGMESQQREQERQLEKQRQREQQQRFNGRSL